MSNDFRETMQGLLELIKFRLKNITELLEEAERMVNDDLIMVSSQSNLTPNKQLNLAHKKRFLALKTTHLKKAKEKLQNLKNGISSVLETTP